MNIDNLGEGFCTRTRELRLDNAAVDFILEDKRCHMNFS